MAITNGVEGSSSESLAEPIKKQEKEPQPYSEGSFDWEEYSASRPGYIDEIYEALFKYHEQTSNNWDKVIDVGCGPGNVTEVLSKRFNTAIGVDRTEPQLEEARKRLPDVKNVLFELGTGEELDNVDDSSVDMLTFATAIHWMDAEKTVREAKRVLRSKGTFASWCYQPVGSITPEWINPIVQDALGKAFTNQVQSAPSQETRNLFNMVLSNTTSDMDNLQFSNDDWLSERRLYWNSHSAEILGRIYPGFKHIDNRGKSSEDYYEEHVTKPSLTARTYTLKQFIGHLRSLDTLSTDQLVEIEKELSERLERDAEVTQVFTMTIVLATLR